MFQKIFEGADFSYFYESKTEQYLLYWRKYDITIRLRNDEALTFKQQLDMINSQPEKDIKARIERTIKIYFYFRYACPIPYFVEE